MILKDGWTDIREIRANRKARFTYLGSHKQYRYEPDVEEQLQGFGLADWGITQLELILIYDVVTHGLNGLLDDGLV